MDITREHLNFLEEAGLAFEANDRLETYQDKDNRFIALRYGADRDCIGVYELKDQVSFFANIMRKAPELRVVYQREKVEWFADMMENQLRLNEHKGGWMDCSSDYLVRELCRNFSLTDHAGVAAEERIRRWVNVANFAMMLADKERS